MKVGIPKEIKNSENRVAITRAGIQMLVSHGHEVLIEKIAGVGSGISDSEFALAGAKMLDTAENVYRSSRF